MSQDTTTYIGLDDHMDSIDLAIVWPGEKQEECFQVANEPGALRRLAKKLLSKAPGRVVCCYEAGANGYELKRRLESHGLECVVVAPSLTPRQPGQRVKTDRRDARQLARYLRAGLLTEVRAPSEAEEAVRDLCRHREAVSKERKRSRQRLGKMLQRRGVRYRMGTRWTKRHWEWLKSIRLEQPADQMILDDALLSLEQLNLRLQDLDERIEELSQQEPYREPVGWLRCFRGIDTLTAMILVTELHGFARFQHPRQLMAYLGLVPGEHSSGARQKRGRITKSGNRLVRWILVEAASHYKSRPRVSKHLSQRRRGQPAEIIALADRAQHRLHRRYYRLLLGSNKPRNKVVVAIARELAGFVWAALQHPPEGSQAAAA